MSDFPMLSRRHARASVGLLAGLVAGVVVLGVAALFLQAWIVMLLLGVVASLSGWSCAIGFWLTFVIMTILAVVAGLFRRSN
jgi:uncharacterized RDD family membrane protein YckC